MDLNIKSALEYLEKSIVAKNKQTKLLQDEITRLNIEHSKLSTEIKKLRQQSNQNQHPQQHTNPAKILLGGAQVDKLDLSLDQFKDLTSKK